MKKEIPMGYGETTNSELERIARIVVDAIYKVHSNLGPGLLESVYSICLAHELRKRGLKVDREVKLPILYDGVRLECGLRLDLVVESCMIVEVKAVEKLIPIFDAQLLTYLKLTGYTLGFLVNFNVTLIKDGMKRVILSAKTPVEPI
jgi:GxxExxY protein